MGEILEDGKRPGTFGSLCNNGRSRGGEVGGREELSHSQDCLERDPPVDEDLNKACTPSENGDDFWRRPIRSHGQELDTPFEKFCSFAGIGVCHCTIKEIYGLGT